MLVNISTRSEHFAAHHTTRESLLSHHILQSIEISNLNSQAAASKQQARAAKPFPCTWFGCSKLFDSKSNLKRHYEGVHLKLYEVHCSYCDRKLSDSSEIAKHIKRNHLEYQGGWTCASCVLHFKSNDKIIKHKKQAHSLKYGCDHCGDEFETEDKWDDHIAECILLNDGFGDEDIEQGEDDLEETANRSKE